VITRNNRIELAARRATENGVSGKWSFDVDPMLLRLMNGGTQHRFLFRTE